MKHILITGGTGFLGQHIIQKLDKKDCNILVPTRTVKNWNISGITWILVDSLQELEHYQFSKLDYIIHLAAMVKHTRYQNDDIYKINVDLTKSIEKIAIKYKARLIIASTSGVMKNNYSITDEDIPSETDEICLKEKWPYYHSKALCELQVKYLNTIFLRPSMILGPGIHSEPRSLGTIKKFLEKKYPFLIEGGINYVDVRDVANAFIKCLDADIPTGKYNLSGTNALISTFMNKLHVLSNIPCPKIYIHWSIAWVVCNTLTYLRQYFDFIPVILDPVKIEMGSSYWNVSNEKSKQILNFNVRDSHITLSDSIKYLSNL